jgi:hypothetical protein
MSNVSYTEFRLVKSEYEETRTEVVKFLTLLAKAKIEHPDLERVKEALIKLKKRSGYSGRLPTL